MICSLKSLCNFVTESVPVEKASLDSYVSTETMIANRGGIISSTSLPKGVSVRCYQKGDVLISNIRPYFKKIWRATKSGTCSNDVLIIRSNGVCNPDYLYYVLSSDSFFNYMTATSKGTKMPRGDKDAIMRFELNLPSREIQDKASSVLVSLDDLITTTSKINDYLSTFCQITFNQWIGQYCLEGLVSLTPKKGYVSLEEMCLTITDGAHYSPKPSVDGNHAMFSVKDMGQYGFNRSNCKMIDDESYLKLMNMGCVPEVDDVLVAKDGSYLKEAFLIDKPISDAILSSIAIFRPNTEIIFPEVLLFLFKHPEVVATVKDNCVTGSAIPRIVLKSFKQIQFPVPDLEQQKGVAILLSSALKIIRNNEEVNEQLKGIRTELLSTLFQETK